MSSRTASRDIIRIATALAIITLFKIMGILCDVLTRVD
jgi:hypothetical protein